MIEKELVLPDSDADHALPLADVKKTLELDVFVLHFRLRRWEDRRKKGVIRILARKRLVLRTIIDR